MLLIDIHPLWCSCYRHCRSSHRPPDRRCKIRCSDCRYSCDMAWYLDSLLPGPMCTGKELRCYCRSPIHCRHCHHHSHLRFDIHKYRFRRYMHQPVRNRQLCMGLHHRKQMVPARFGTSFRCISREYIRCYRYTRNHLHTLPERWAGVG